MIVLASVLLGLAVSTHAMIINEAKATVWMFILLGILTSLGVFFALTVLVGRTL